MPSATATGIPTKRNDPQLPVFEKETILALPLALLLLVQFAPLKEAPAQNEAGIADSSETRSVKFRTRQAKRENSVAKQDAVVIETEPAPVLEIGAISTDPMRMTKQATPYEPGTVPGDSGVMVQYVGSPDDMVSGPQPLPPDDPWDGAVLPPITPEKMR